VNNFVQGGSVGGSKSVKEEKKVSRSEIDRRQMRRDESSDEEDENFEEAQPAIPHFLQNIPGI
jgi:nitrate reductase cytochrome c-type subunit